MAPVVSEFCQAQSTTYVSPGTWNILAAGKVLLLGKIETYCTGQISYGQLKKCIKKVQLELSDIGLETSVVQRLLQNGNDKEVGRFLYGAESL